MIQTTYRIRWPSIAIQTTDPAAAEDASKQGAVVTASTTEVA